MERGRRVEWRMIGLAAIVAAGAAWAQSPPQGVPRPGAVETVPLGPPGAPPPVAPLPGGGVTITQDPPASRPAPVAVARPTLIPQAGDPSNVDEVVLPEKDVLILAGSSTWADAYTNLRAAFAAIEAELAKAGIAPAGRPLTIFIATTDDDFRYEAMIPVARLPEPATASQPDMRYGKTPSGKAYRFVHKGAYEEVDSTYETITTYLDAKDILAKDAFIEEYVNDVADPADVSLELNIFVQPR